MINRNNNIRKIIAPVLAIVILVLVAIFAIKSLSNLSASDVDKVVGNITQLITANACTVPANSI